jgi:hypothetical protein
VRWIVVVAAACSSSTKSPATTTPEPPPRAATWKHHPGDLSDLADAQLAVVQKLAGVSLLQSTNTAFHEHGGDAAIVDHVRLIFEVDDHRAHEIEAREVALLRRHCMEKAWRDRDPLKLTGHEAWRDTLRLADNKHVPRHIPGDVSRVVIPAREPARYVVNVSFEPVEVYQACDIFGFALDLVVDRVRVPVELEFSVTRFDPID